MQFDSQISNALAFVQKLQADPVNNSLRGPYLATIEVERRKHLRGKGNDDSLMDAIVQYFCRYLVISNLLSFKSLILVLFKFYLHSYLRSF